MYTEKIYIVIWQDRFNGIMIGYLPFDRIPQDSNLRHALFSPDYHLQIDSSGGLRGIYEERHLAAEHMRIESNWRNNPEREVRVWIQTIKAKKIRQGRES